MGLTAAAPVATGPPKALMLLVRDKHGADCFVETGTFEGRTAEWAASEFRRVVTIERSPRLFDVASALLRALTNVERVLGDSRTTLRDLAPTLTSPTVFWLDAHWSGGTTAGETDECPLLDELAAIASAPAAAFTFIDDARLFLRPPPPPHDPAAWPTLPDVIDAARAGAEQSIAVVDDIILAFPEGARELIVETSRRAGASHKQSVSARILALISRPAVRAD
jgi:hypothetical protein